MAKRKSVYAGDYAKQCALPTYPPYDPYYRTPMYEKEVASMTQQYLIWHHRPNQHWCFHTIWAATKRDAMTKAGVPRDATAHVVRVADTTKFAPKADEFPWTEVKA